MTPVTPVTPAREVDVVVLGAGPAGALSAFLAARSGRSVLLLDKARFPRAKVCGCTLDARALAALDRAGLPDLVAAAGAVPLRSLRLAHRGRTAVLPLHGHAALSRERLDLALVEAARAAGAEVATGCPAAAEDAFAAGGPLVRLGDGRRLRARALVVADGLGSRVLGEPEVAPAARVGVAATLADGGNAHASYAPGVLAMAVGDTGYAGVVRLEDGRLEVAAALDSISTVPAAATGPRVAAILAEAGLPRVAGLERAAFRGTPALTRRRPCVARGAAFAVGDAAGYVEPFTGEGIGWALASALAAAPFVDDAVRGGQAADGAAKAYAAALASVARRRQRACRAFAWSLRHGPLVGAAVSLLNAWPALGARIVARLDRAARSDVA